MDADMADFLFGCPLVDYLSMVGEAYDVPTTAVAATQQESSWLQTCFMFSGGQL